MKFPFANNWLRKQDLSHEMDSFSLQRLTEEGTHEDLSLPLDFAM